MVLNCNIKQKSYIHECDLDVLHMRPNDFSNVTNYEKFDKNEINILLSKLGHVQSMLLVKNKWPIPTRIQLPSRFQQGSRIAVYLRNSCFNP